MKEILKKLVEKIDLAKEEIFLAVECALKNEHPIQVGAFLALMQAKKITPDELIWVLKALAIHSNFIEVPYQTVDIVGTGGDQANTFNISTGAAILAAACGLKVAKHGNRAATSKCGSADVIEKLGVKLESSKQDLLRCLEKVGIAFMFAQTFNPAIKSVKEVRTKLGIRTFFNLVGPLLNPAKVQYMIVGVYEEGFMELISKVLLKLNKTALVVCGDKTDEITTVQKTRTFLIQNGKIKRGEIDPQSLGFKLCTFTDLEGKDIAYNAEKLVQVLKGERGPWADTLILNVAVALHLCGKVSSLKEGVKKAKEVHEKGMAYTLLEKWIECSKEKQ